MFRVDFNIRIQLFFNTNPSIKFIMFIKKINFANLQNEEHFQFHSYFDTLVNETGPDVLKIVPQYAAYKPLLVNERLALDVVLKSQYTSKIQLADTARDIPVQGFSKVVNGMTHHFNPDISAAAHRIKVIIDSFSGITRLPYENQTAATIKLVDELKAVKDDIVLMGLTDWLTEIEVRNTAFDTLVKSRFTETDDRTTLRMKHVRIETDEAYNTITDRINAFITLDGDTGFAPFVNKLNNRIDSFTTAVAIRKGRTIKGKETPVS